MNEKRGKFDLFTDNVVQLTILHYITELFVSHSAIGLTIHVNNLLYLIT